MIKGIYHSAAGMLARQKQLEVVANNISNAGTTGFKQENVCFKSTLNSTLAEARPVTVGERFVDVEGSPAQINRQGTLTITSNPLDVAIIGEGYFTVETPAGVAFTRDGRFRLNADGELVTLTGYRVLTEGGTAVLPQGDLKISSDGSLMLKAGGGDREQVLDRLQMVSFPRPAELTHYRDGLYTTQQDPIELDEVKLEIGCLEESTVNLVAEMVKMIEINQYYDASARAVQTQDATLGKAVNEVGKA